MELLKDILLVAGRIVTIFPLMLIIAIYMGKRSIGELPVFDFLVIIALGAVVGADIADPKIEHMPTAAAIILIGLIQRIVASLAIKFRRFGKWITFEPTVVIHHGNLNKENLKKARYSIDNILLMLREKNIFNIEEVELAILEANGRLTVYPSPHKATVTVEQMGLKPSNTAFAYPVILEGTVMSEVLAYLNKDVAWLEAKLKESGFDKEDVFFASVNEQLEVHISKPYFAQMPPVSH